MKADWAILDIDGSVLDRFFTSQEAYEATYTWEYPEGSYVAYINDPGPI